ncbi:MAG: caspase family protein, partial [Treponema sp.]|nr:caspase family protein [Treponema sp.]
MKKLSLIFFIITFCSIAYAQQKYALVIGNGNYTSLGKLRNPVNDAEDVAAVLSDLGFNVEKVLDGDLDRMESAVLRLKNRLSVSKNTYGFLFYAGHGVQSNGLNYLIPVGASIPSEGSLRERSMSVQWMLGEINDAGNELNVVVLDACRDNPFIWARSGSRGLTVIGNQPADSIVVYATSAGSVAQDGTGRNGLFTSHLLKNLKTPGLEVTEIFRRTGFDVSDASNRKQVPAVSVQFFGTAYFSKPVVAQAPVTPP